MNELSEVVALLRNDWRTLVTDLLLGILVIGIVCAFNYKLALVAFAVLSYVAGAFILAVAALFIGFKVKEKIDAWTHRDYR